MGQLQITHDGYEEIKQIIRDKLNETADNFIVIGYYLKQVRDNLLYEMDGYRSMAEFAKGQYGISQSTASRFMDINTKFSKDGNSTEISEQYRGYGASKLQEMLTMDEEDLELVTPETTVKQIKEIKEAERTERQQEEQEAARHLPIMEMAGRADDTAEEKTYATSQEQTERTPIEQTLAALWKSRPELLALVRNGMITAGELAEQLSPSGSRTFSHRTYMLFLYTCEAGVKFRYYANGKANVDAYTYDGLIVLTQEMAERGLFDTVKEEPAKASEDFMNKPEEPAEKEPEVRTWETPELVDNPAGQQEGYEPLPGQMTLNGQDGIEVSATAEPESVTDEPKSVTAEPENATTETMPGQQEYAAIELANAKSYFEMEIERMTNMSTATRESIRCRNYKIALEAIKGYFNV